MTTSYFEDIIDNTSSDFTEDIDETIKLKKKDKRFQKYKIPFNKKWTDGRFYKNLFLEFYGSGQQGTLIRNAVTGLNTFDKVGSSKESLYFKVSDALALNKQKDPLTLFYDSPEQYENHFFVTVPKQVKIDWYRNFNNKLAFTEEKEEYVENSYITIR